MSSKRRSSGIKRGSRGGKQPGIVETFARVRPSCAAIEESLTVIDLDSDDPVSEIRYWYLLNGINYTEAHVYCCINE